MLNFKKIIESISAILCFLLAVYLSNYFTTWESESIYRVTKYNIPILAGFFCLVYLLILVLSSGNLFKTKNALHIARKYFIGLSFINTIFFLILSFGLFTWINTIIICSLILLFGFNLKDFYIRKNYKYLLILLIIYFLIGKGLYPDIVSNDSLGHYLPYYQSVIEGSGIMPNQWHYHFFFSKGNSIFYVISRLTNVQYVQIASLLSLVFLLIYINNFLNRYCIKQFIINISIFFIILTPLYSGEFQKHHIVLACFLVYCMFEIYKLYQNWVVVDFILLILPIFSLTILTPIATILLITWVLVLHSFFYYRQIHIFIKILSILIISLLFIYSYNYFISGFFEISPPFLSNLYSNSISSQWTDPNIILIQAEYSRLQMVNTLLNLNFNLFDILYFIVNYKLFFINLIIFIFLFSKDNKYKFRKSSIYPLIFSLLIYQLICLILDFYFGGSTTRILIFTHAIGIVSIAMMINLILPSFHYRLMMFIYILAVSFFLVFTFNYNKILFSFGLRSYIEIYEDWDLADGIEIAKYIPNGYSCVELTFSPGFSLVKGNKFSRPDTPIFHRDFSKIILSTPDEAINYLKYSKAIYALIQDGKNPTYTAFSPVYSPNSLISNFSLVKHFYINGHNYYLFKINHNPLISNEDVNLINKWSLVLDAWGNGPEAKVYNYIKNK